MGKEEHDVYVPNHFSARQLTCYWKMTSLVKWCRDMSQSEMLTSIGIGCLVLASMLAILMTLSRFYGDGTHPSGARAGIAFIFLYSLLYAVFFNSTLYTIAAETFPQHLRGYGTSVAALCQGVTAIWMGQVTPFAFAKLGWRYYAVFVACLAVLGCVYGAWLVESRGVGLEAVAGEWGDEVVVREQEVLAEGVQMTRDAGIERKVENSVIV